MLYPRHIKVLGSFFGGGSFHLPLPPSVPMPYSHSLHCADNIQYLINLFFVRLTLDFQLTVVFLIHKTFSYETNIKSIWALSWFKKNLFDWFIVPPHIYIYIYIYIIYIYIYIYIYFVIDRRTVSFYQNSSVWLHTADAWSRDRNPSKFTLQLASDRSANKRTTLA